MDFLTWLPLIFVFVLLALRVPVCLSFISGALLYFGFIAPELPLSMTLSKMVTSGMSINLLAIPFFITSGLLMDRSGLSSRLLGLADTLVGHFWGGLAQVNVLLSAFNGGLTGSGNADAAMDCKMLVPEMERRGFNRAFSAAVSATSALIAPMIPPGVCLILYATTTETSVVDMFMAGYLPGILMTVAEMLAVCYVSHRDGYKPTREKRASLKEIGKACIDSFWAIVLILFLIVGLRTGLVTASEGGAALCLLCAFVGTFIYKELKPKDYKEIFHEAFVSSANIFGIIVSATVFGLYLTYAQIPRRLTEIMLSVSHSPMMFLFVVNIMLLIMGMFVDGSAIIMIAAPMLYPAAMEFGIDPIHFGIVMILNLSLGGLTPPFGAGLYQCCNLCNVEMPEFLKQVKELFLALLIVLILVTVFPWISTFLPYAAK